MDAFYCQLDRSIYLDPVFLSEQHALFGDYAPIVVLAHEWGHHVQNLLRVPDLGGNAYELQADCLAGVFTQYAEEQGLLESGDLAEAIGISEAFGEPAGLPQDRPGAHGTDKDRIKALMRGYLDSTAGCELFPPTLPPTSAPASIPTPVPTPTVVRLPTPATAPDLSNLPGSLPLPHAACFRIEQDTSLSFDDLLVRLGGADDARQRLQEWGWQASSNRTFACDAPPDGEAGWIDVSLHVFASPDAAQEAVDYFTAKRAEGTSLTNGSAPQLGDYAAALSGPTGNGSEFTIYASQGPVLLRVTGVAPSGIPFGNVLAVARAILAGSQDAPSGGPPARAMLPASAYLPPSPAVNHAECFRVLAHGTYSYGEIVAALEDVGLSASQIDGLGWVDGAYVVFSCAAPPSGRASQIDVVVHQFRDSQSAQQAMRYVSDTYVPGSHELRSCDNVGALVVCVTGRSLSGSPLSDVQFVLHQVVNSVR